MKRVLTLALAALAAMAMSYGCKGANDVSGIGNGDVRQPTPTPHVTGLRPTPNPCQGKNRIDC